MTTATDTSTAECVDGIRATVDTVFSQITEWRAGLESAIADASPTRTHIDATVERLVLPAFSRAGNVIIGAGFVATPGFIADAPWHLAWWLGSINTFGVATGTPAIRRLIAEEDPEAESFRDYTSLEWWRVPARTGAQHITGPYVDYLCTDEYTLTLTAPVMRDDTMIGVVGADLYVNDLEQLLLPRLRRIGAVATLVNTSGRVVVSTDPHRAPGSLLRIDGLAAALADESATDGGLRSTRLASGESVVPCGDTSLALVINRG